MDWATEAARRKMQRLPGSSRSLIESLNALNTVDRDANVRFNRAIQSTTKLLDECRGIMEGAAGAMLSPEKTIARFDQDVSAASGNAITTDTTTPYKQQKHVYSPRIQSSAHNETATPTSVTKVDPPAAVAAPASNRSFSWSPFRSETSQHTKTSVALPLSNSSSAASTIAITNIPASTKKIPAPRRSNMFVPLPNKDPLILKPVLPSLKKVNFPKQEVTTQGLIPTKLEKPVKNLRPDDKKSNVFDRLSAAPTTSFRHKINAKRKLSFSTNTITTAADMTGSPKKRKSPKKASASLIPGDMELKDIFESKLTTKYRTSLLPISTAHSAKKESGTKEFKLDSVKTVESSTIKEEPKVSPKNVHLSPEQQHPSFQQSVAGEKTGLPKYDRLTKFKLHLPQRQTGKTDVKEKLKKRLSEVSRTRLIEQQQRRTIRYESHKRKSHFDENRTRLYTGTPALRSKARKSNITNSSIQPVSKNGSFLHDLNTVDHRNIIGGAPKSTTKQGKLLSEQSSPRGDNTLPDISSDFDDEYDGDDDYNNDRQERYILAPWARSPALKKQLLKQQDIDPRSIFGPIPPLHIDEIFQSSRLNKLKAHQT